MKRLWVLSFVAIVISSCTTDYYEPRYDARDRVVGNYELEEYSDTFNDVTYYSIRISKSGYDREIYLNNFYASGLRVYAILSNDQITIPFQVVDGYEIDGVGDVYGNELHLSYRVKDRVNNARTDFCKTTGWLE